MTHAFIAGGLRTPIGTLGGALGEVRPDDLAAHVIRELVRRHPSLDAAEVTDVIFGCANQAGEDNRNVARMAALLAGLPVGVPGETVNRLCASGLSAVASAARGVRLGEGDLYVAGGVESMTRAPFVMAKTDSAFSRNVKIEDTTIGWRFVNPQMKAKYGVDSMAETAENVAEEYKIARADQDQFALRSQQRWAAANEKGFFKPFVVPVSLPQKKGDPKVFSVDEHPRPDTTIEALAKLKGVVKEGGTITAGNASGVNDGACALILANEDSVRKYDLKPRARVIAAAAAGVAPRIMGVGPVPATRKALQIAGLKLSQIEVFELNEAFAAQSLACTRELGLPDGAAHVNANGGAIAVGHPLGASGGRIAMEAVAQLHAIGGRYAVCTMCIGVGQGIAMVLERV